MSRILVAVAWPYANGPFHIGHLAGAYLPGEIFARFHRLRGDDVLMVSGSDMHGTPILVRAEQEGKSPAEVADRFHALHEETFQKLGFTFDTYTQTHTVVHERTTHELFLTLLKNGFVDRRTEENPYCPKHQRFLPDRYLVGTCPNCGNESARGDECDRCGRVLGLRDLRNPRCSLCGTPAEYRPSEHFYLRLDLLSEKLDQYLGSKSFWRPNVIEYARGFRAGGLKPTPITRDIDWGIPLPLDGYEGKRFYVWFEAVIGYLSASKEWAIRSGHPDAWRDFWSPDAPVRQYYFLGKDNIFHHALFWPGMLLGHGGLQLPYEVAGSQWLVLEGAKLSKSRPAGEDVFLPSMLAKYPPDVIRFYAATHAPQNHDTEFHWEEFHQLWESVLSNQYGNFVQRQLAFVRDRMGGKVPEPPAGWSPDRSAMGTRIRSAHERITEEYERVHLKEALDLAVEEIREGNRRLQEARPWEVPDEERRRALYEGLWLVRAAAVWLSPVIPFSSHEVARMTRDPALLERGNWDRVLTPPTPGQTLGTIRPLFPREEPGAARPTGGMAPPPRFDATPALEILSGNIRTVEPVPGADKLFRFSVDVGEPEPRTVVAGLRPYYTAEALRGRRVAFLANLRPRTIRNVVSRGMVLAAEDGDRVVLLEPPRECDPGTRVVGGSPEPPEVTHEEFERFPLVIGHVLGPSGNGSVRVDVGGRQVTAGGDWNPGRSVVVRLLDSERPCAEILSFGSDLALTVPEEFPPGARVR